MIQTPTLTHTESEKLAGIDHSFLAIPSFLPQADLKLGSPCADLRPWRKPSLARKWPQWKYHSKASNPIVEHHEHLLPRTVPIYLSRRTRRPID